MSVFSATVQALLAGRKINAALLTTLDFGDEQLRLFLGYGSLLIEGNRYTGDGLLLSIEGLGYQGGTFAAQAKFRLSGVDSEIMQRAVEQRDTVVGAPITCAVQVLGDGEIADDWQPVGGPIGIGAWEGDQLAFDINAPSAQRAVTLTGITEFEARSRPPNSYYSDRDQKLRYSGDRGGELMSALQNQVINWPV